MASEAGPSVSIVTITQFSRRRCLEHLSTLLHQQDYNNIIEWVIVEGSPDESDSLKNATLISDLKSDIPIHFIYKRPRQSLSDLRNTGNAASRGDIIVCMDDDDYYPPTRVSHAVCMLQNSSALIAGCSNAYIYFYWTRMFFQLKRLGKGHSTNNCLAYKQAYLKTHLHEPGLNKAEESSFTNGFTEPMVQLEPMKTIVISGHHANTVNKSLLSPNIMTEMPVNTITDYIPSALLQQMSNLFAV